MAKTDCEYCEGTGVVEWDATDSRGEHRSESGPCDCVEEDADGEADNELDRLDIVRNYRVSFKGSTYGATVEASCKRQAVSIAVLDAKLCGFSVRHRKGIAEEV